MCPLNARLRTRIDKIHDKSIGRIENMNGEKAPIIGFLFYNEDYFIGRIMSFFGPAPHLWGIYTPN